MTKKSRFEELEHAKLNHFAVTVIDCEFANWLCVLELELNNDDKALAGDWLFSSGAKALEQMAADALRSQANVVAMVPHAQPPRH